MLFDVSAAADPHVAPPRIWPSAPRPPSLSLSFHRAATFAGASVTTPKFSVMREKRGRGEKPM